MDFRGAIWPWNLFQGCYLTLEFISGVLFGLGIYFRDAIWPWNLFQGCYLALEFISGVLFGLGIHSRGAIWPYNLFQGCYFGLRIYIPQTCFQGVWIVVAIFRI